MTRDEERLAMLAEPLIDHALKLWESDFDRAGFIDSKRVDAIHDAVHALASLSPEYTSALADEYRIAVQSPRASEMAELADAFAGAQDAFRSHLSRSA